MIVCYSVPCTQIHHFSAVEFLCSHLLLFKKKTVIEQNQVLETKAPKPSVQLALRKFTLMVQGSNLKASTCKWLTSVPSFTPWLASMPPPCPTCPRLEWVCWLPPLCALYFFFMCKTSEDNLREPFVSFYCVGPGDWAQVTRLCDKCPFL